MFLTDLRIDWMNLQNIHSDLKFLLEEAISQKNYKKAMDIITKLIPPSFNSDIVEGILFKDVKKIVSSKEDLENILLSTRVFFEQKEELLEFFDMLLKYGFRENAISYFEDLITQMNDLEIIDGFNNLLTK